MNLTLSYEFKDGALVEEDGGIVKYWKGFGLHDFEGDWQSFSDCYPEQMRILLDKGIVKVTPRG